MLCGGAIVGRRGRRRPLGSVALFPPPSRRRVEVLKLPKFVCASPVRGVGSGGRCRGGLCGRRRGRVRPFSPRTRPRAGPPPPVRRLARKGPRGAAPLRRSARPFVLSSVWGRRGGLSLVASRLPCFGGGGRGVWGSGVLWGWVAARPSPAAAAAGVLGRSMGLGGGGVAPWGAWSFYGA